MAFRAIWGQRWTDQIAEVPVRMAVNIWAEGLAGLSPEQLRAKLAWCRDRLAWPPSIAEFRQAGEPAKPKTRTEWLAWGAGQGRGPAPGEEWDNYIARLAACWESK